MVNEDRGAAVVLLTMLLSMFMVVVLAVAGVVRVGAARAQASTAADLAALAAVPAGDCDVARRVAEQNDAQLHDCHVDAADVVVQTSVAVHMLGRAWRVTAMSRAGPP